MDTDPNAKALRIAQQLEEAGRLAKELDCDSSDSAEAGPSDGTATFTLYQFVERPVPPGLRRPAGPPLGQWVTKVTVKAEWHPFEE